MFESMSEIVSLDVAKLLKKSGFKKWCSYCYTTAVMHNGEPIGFDEECELKDEGYGDEIEYIDGGELSHIGFSNKDEDSKAYAAPTISAAMAWLREDKGVAVVPIVSSVLDNEKFLWDVKIIVAKTNETYSQGWIYERYESACDAALKYVLESLIS